MTNEMYIIPGNLRVHHISCCEEYYDKENETRGYKVTTKSYLFWMKGNDSN